MPLSDEDRQRIYEEEMERARIRQQLEYPPRKSIPPKNEGVEWMKACCLLGVALIFLLILMGSCSMHDILGSGSHAYTPPPLPPSDITSNPISEDKPLTWGMDSTYDLEVSDVQAFTGSYDSGYGEITGKITNHTNNTLRYVEIDFNLSNDQGHQTDTAMTNTTDLGPHKVWEFKATVLSRDWSHWDITRVQGDKQQ